MNNLDTNISINYNQDNLYKEYAEYNNRNNNNINDINNKHHKQRTLHINIDELDLYYQLFKEDINTNRETHMKFIENNPAIHNDYIKLYDAVTKFDEKCWKESVEHNLPLRHCFIDPDGHMKNYGKIDTNMTGGTPLTAGIVVGTFILTGIIASLIWYFVHPREVCKPTYPLYPHDKIPNIGGIIEKILPGTW